MIVKNPVLAFFWNTFDFFIRFVYCNTVFFGPFISKTIFWKLYSSDYYELDKKFEKLFLLLKKNDISLKGKTVIEIGPGNSYVIALNFIMNGAKKVILIDKFSRVAKNKKQQEYFNDEINFIAKKFGKKPFFIESVLNNGQINFIESDLLNEKIGPVDFVFSNSVFEHLKNVKKYIKAMFKLLNENGYMVHSIDLRDHYNFSRPFLFYKYSNWVWDAFLTREGHSYTNRLRAGDFIGLFKGAGFKIICEIRKREKMRGVKLSEGFSNKSISDLETTHLQLLLKK